MDNRIKRIPTCEMSKVYLVCESWVNGMSPDIQRSEGKLRKGKCLDTGPINEDEITSVCPDLTDTLMKGEGIF